jgi:hypothetical protein
VKRILIALAAVAGLFVLTAPTADAQVLECQVTGVLIIIAINGPVTACSIDTNATESNSVNIPIAPINPHFGQPN